jgi:hypothetical protein
MDFSLSRPQEIMRRTLRDFMQREYPSAAVREAEASERGYLPAVYQQLGDLGLLGFGLPQADGGAGGGWAEVCVFSEEAGRALFAGPYLPSLVLGGQLLARWGSAAQRQEWLPALAKGRRALAVAWPIGQDTPGPSGLAARAENGSYRLSGEVAQVAGWPGADGVLLVAEVAEADGKLGLFLAAPDTTAETGYQGGPEYRGYLQRCHVAETEEKAMDNARQFMWMQGEFTGLAHPVWSSPSGYFSPAMRTAFVEYAVGRRSNPRGAAFEDQIRDQQIIAGTPKTVIPKLRRLLEETRPSILGFWASDGFVSNQDTQTCIRLLGQEVLPALRDIGKELGLWSPFEANAPVSLAHPEPARVAGG